MKKLALAILCLCALFAGVFEVGSLSNDDNGVKTCAKKDDEDEVRVGGPYEGFYLFFKTMNH